MAEKIKSGVYEGKNKWMGWFSTHEWIGFYRPGEVKVYARDGETDKAIGLPREDIARLCAALLQLIGREE